jgi:cobalt-zinc-cadmium efflux system outer membrane protein
MMRTASLQKLTALVAVVCLVGQARQARADSPNLLAVPSAAPQPLTVASDPPANALVSSRVQRPAETPMRTGPTPEPVAPPTALPPVPQALGLDQLEAMALSHNPTLAQASARVNSMRGNWTQQGLYPNPRLAYKGDEMGDENRSGFQGFTVAQEIVTKGKLGLAQNVASQQVQQAEQEYAAQEFRVRNDVKLRFYEVLLAQRALELNQEMEQISGVAVDASNNLFQANQVGRTDVLQARVENDTVQLQTVKARNAHESAWRRLTTVIGMPDLPPQPLAGDLRQDIAESSWDEAWGRLWSSSPELAAAQAKVGAAQWAVKKACADRCPNYDVEAGYSHDNATGFDTGGIMVTVPVPIFNRNQGAIRQANAELHAASAEVERVALDLRNRLALMFERYTTAREFVNRYEIAILPNAKESVELASSRYRAGESNYTALLLAQRTYLQTQIAYLESLRELRETSVLINGMLLSDSLAGAGK